MVCSPHKINKMYWYNCMQHKYYEYRIKCKLSVERNYDVKHELNQKISCGLMTKLMVGIVPEGVCCLSTKTKAMGE